ncbi:hypothetical protein BH24ACI5_BH24ACI5_22300 [soil metagenome]
MSARTPAVVRTALTRGDPENDVDRAEIKRPDCCEPDPATLHFRIADVALEPLTETCRRHSVSLQLTQN